MTTKKKSLQEDPANSAPGAGSAPLVVLPLTTSPETVTMVREAGYIPILTDDVAKVKIIVPGSDMIGGDLLMSAMHALCRLSDDSGRAYMTEELFRRMKLRETAQNNADEVSPSLRGVTSGGGFAGDTK